MPQEMAPGLHYLRRMHSTRTFFRRVYVEEWLCMGCMVRFTVRSKSFTVVDWYGSYLKDMHDGHLSDERVWTNVTKVVTDAKAGIVQTVAGQVQTHDKITVKADFTSWDTGRLMRVSGGIDRG